MNSLTSDNITILFLSLGVLLCVARLLGEIAQWLKQPAVLGELLAGVLLGPTIMGSLAPELSSVLFPLQGVNAIALEAIATLAIVLFLLVAGMEVDLSTVWKQSKIGCKVGITSIVFPFSIAFIAALVIPESLGRHLNVDPLIFALFFAIAISISALPIIAKTLMDMGLYRSDMGMVVISAAVFNDLVGWIVFAVILGLMGDHSGNANSIVQTIALTLVFVVTTLTIGRWLIHKALPLVKAYTRWPAGELSFALILGLLGAAFTQWIGIHAIFGAFIVGAMGIVVGMIALNAGIIHERLFVALIIMAMLTSMMSGPFMQMILRTGKERRLRDILSPILRVTSRYGSIRTQKKPQEPEILGEQGARSKYLIQVRRQPWKRYSPARTLRRSARIGFGRFGVRDSHVRMGYRRGRRCQR